MDGLSGQYVYVVDANVGGMMRSEPATNETRVAVLDREDLEARRWVYTTVVFWLLGVVQRSVLYRVC